MKLLLYVTLGFLANCYGFERGDLEKFGPFQLGLHSGLIKCDHDRSPNLDVSDTDVFFYDFPNKQTKIFPIKDAAKGILAYPQLDKVKQLFIFVGGFKSHINKTITEEIRQTFRNFPNSYLIIFDHSAYTHDRQGMMNSYARSVKYVHYIGKAIAEFLTELKSKGISSKSMHCIGHSLGSQILGHTGEIFFKNTGEKIKRITGLDPAGPCFSNSLIQEQLRSGVADYVEVYHCNAGGFGTTSVLADIDFFINKKGESQPDCKPPLIPGLFDSPKAARCSHRFCIDLWIASVKNPKWYLAWKCDSYKKFTNGECAGNEVTTAGFWNPGNSTGVFYFTTTGYDVKKSSNDK